MSTATVSSDSHVILLLCTRLALPRHGSELKPLSRSEWNDLARAIDVSTFKRPGALLGAFHLQKAQTKAWLQRAVDQGLVRKLSKPTRFERIHAAEDSQASLFEP